MRGFHVSDEMRKRLKENQMATTKLGGEKKVNEEDFRRSCEESKKFKSIFVVTYRWLDLAGAPSTTETYTSLNEAEDRAGELRKDEDGRKVHDPASTGQLEIIIDRYNFDVQCSRITI